MLQEGEMEVCVCVGGGGRLSRIRPCLFSNTMFLTRTCSPIQTDKPKLMINGRHDSKPLCVCVCVCVCSCVHVCTSIGHNHACELEVNASVCDVGVLVSTVCFSLHCSELNL